MREGEHRRNAQGKFCLGGCAKRNEETRSELADRLNLRAQRFGSVGDRLNLRGQRFGSVGDRLNLRAQRFGSVGDRLKLRAQRFGSVGEREKRGEPMPEAREWTLPRPRVTNS